VLSGFEGPRVERLFGSIWASSCGQFIGAVLFVVFNSGLRVLGLRVYLGFFL
jgi:hypothetical protein